LSLIDQNEEQKKEEKEERVAKILLYTYSGISSYFFNNLKAANLYDDKQTKLLLEGFMRRLLKFNSLVECLVERRQLPNDEIALQIVHGKMKPLNMNA